MPTSDKTKREEQSGREKLKERYPDLYAFIVELEKVFGPVTGRVKSR